MIYFATNSYIYTGADYSILWGILPVLITFITLLVINVSIVHTIKHSKKWLHFLEINNKYGDKNLKLKSSYFLKIPLSSSKKFYELNVEERIKLEIVSRLNSFTEISQKAKRNNDKLKEYQTEIKSIANTPQNYIKSNHIPIKLYYKIENKIIAHKSIHFDNNPTFIFNFYYRSPAGKKYLEKEYKVDIAFINKTLKELENGKLEKKRRELERSLMTASLRYEILKRDNFKCVLCGASKNDGIKLHVDHIVPISKGGKTIKSNLRTLCEDCNIGKGDKLE